MKKIETKIKDLFIIVPTVFSDERGFFMETYNRERYREIGIKEAFVQDNLSMSAKGVLRGLHYQKSPYAQGKLVYVIAGGVLDVAVDIRPQSKTFGQWVSVELTEKNKKQFWIPPNFAHGFLAIEDKTIFAYKCTDSYVPEAESALLWHDADINVDWQFTHYNIKKPIVSQKDASAQQFKSLKNDLFI